MCMQGTYDEIIVIDGVDVSLIAVGPVTIAPTIALLLPRQCYTSSKQRSNND